MEQVFRRVITRFGQSPLVLLRPLALHYGPSFTKVGLYYPDLMSNPFSIVLFLALLMSYGGGAVIKFLFYKPRPIPQPFHNRLQKIDASSFPSVHTSNASVIGIIRAWWGHQSLMAGELTIQIIPLVVSVVGICSAIALSRIALGKHYPIDVLAGMLFGVLICAVVGLSYMYGLFYWR